LSIRVSVIIPTYQSEQFIRQAIDSVLAQTYKDYEVIVVDGKSTDGTMKVLKSYGNSIRTLTQNGKGIANARNFGIVESKGEYISFLDSDDLWLRDKLAIQVRFLDQKPASVGLIYSDAFLFPEDDVSRLSYLANKRAFQVGNPHSGKVLGQLFIANFIPASTVMVRRTCFERVGLFDESLVFCEDIDMWMRIAEYFEIDYQRMVLGKVRLHLGSATQNKEQLLRSQIILENKTMKRMPYLLERFGLKNIQRSHMKKRLGLGIEYLRKNKKDDARQEFERCIRMRPSSAKAYFLLIFTLFPFSLIDRLPLGKGQRNWTKTIYENIIQ
jgi:glycosyltransferase involved in cell wall biosynthesis